MSGNLASRGAVEEAGGDELTDVEAVVTYLSSELADVGLGGAVAAAVRKLVQPLHKAADYGSLHKNLVELQRDLSTILATLEKADKKLDRLEKKRADAERFGPVWWRQRQRRISDQPSPEQRADQWVKVFAEALLAERFDVCTRLASSAYPA